MEVLVELFKPILFLLIILEGFNLIIPGQRDLIIGRFLSGVMTSLGNAAEPLAERLTDAIIWIIALPFRMLGWLLRSLLDAVEAFLDEDDDEDD